MILQLLTAWMWQKPLSLRAGKLCGDGSSLLAQILPMNTSGPLLPLLLLLYTGKGFLIYYPCPTELNGSKLMIKGMTGDNAL